MRNGLTGEFSVAAVAALVAVGLYAMSEGYKTHTAFTCSRCRVFMSEQRYWGIPFRTISATDYSRWYENRIPLHAHKWCSSGSSKNYYLLSMARSCGRGHPIWGLNEGAQRYFVETSTEAELQEFYARMDSEDYARQERMVQKAESRYDQMLAGWLHPANDARAVLENQRLPEK